MSNNHNKRGRHPVGNPTLWRIVIVLVVAAVVAVVVGRGHKSVEPVPAAIDYAALMDVDIPSGVSSIAVQYPGFNMSFNPDHHMPNWVAWELTANELNNPVTSRDSSTFLQDMAVMGCATLDDYRGSGYDRGHMAPAGDMKWNKEAMDACFLLTNMCPQKKSLNTGAWNKLEEKCRVWALRDSAIYIVCGPVLTDRLTQTIGPSQVDVPERFYKVVLSPHTNPPMGIGFVMPNTNVTGGMQATAMSIDEVEAITGFDFFAALPDPIEDVVEAQNNYARWNRR